MTQGTHGSELSLSITVRWGGFLFGWFWWLFGGVCSSFFGGVVGVFFGLVCFFVGFFLRGVVCLFWGFFFGWVFLGLRCFLLFVSWF